MAYSKAQGRATAKWDKQNYDKICFTAPKGFNSQLKEFCEENGISIRAFIIKSLEDAMKGEQEHGKQG